MALIRQVSCIRKRNYYFDPHEIIESLGGEYLGAPWRMPDFLVIEDNNAGLQKQFVNLDAVLLMKKTTH